jgi:hypothetical protein
MKAHQIARGTLGLLAVSEVAAALLRQRDRRTTFSAAQARARELGRPLVVVGDPHAGAWTSMMPAYGCGDTCVDINGCPGCQTSHTVDLAAAQVPQAADSAVVYSSCVLEYVPDPQRAWAELLRLAGAPENVFLVTVQSWTATSSFYPGARWIVRREGVGTPTFEAVTPARGAAWGALIAGSAVVAAAPLVERTREARQNPARSRRLGAGGLPATRRRLSAP